MKTPILKLPPTQPPKPSQASLAPLVALYKEADKAGAHHWKATQRIGLLRAACDFLEEGQWDRAEDAAEKALKREEDGLAGDYAARFAELLIKLKDKATHHANGEALKGSLRKELQEKKDEPTARTKPLFIGGVSRGPAPSVGIPQRQHQPETHQAREGAARELSTVHEPLAPRPLHDAVAMGGGVGGDGRDPEPRQERPAPTAPNPQCNTTPDHPYLTARDRRLLIDAYWGAIGQRVGTEIMRCTLACKAAGLVEVFRETLWQLEHKDLHQAHRRARQIAVEAWEKLS